MRTDAAPLPRTARRLAPTLSFALALGVAAPAALASSQRQGPTPSLTAPPAAEAAEAAEVDRAEVTPSPELLGLVNVLLHAVLGDHAPVLVALYNVNSHETAHFFIPVTGELDEATAAQVADFFRCRRTRRSKRMKPGVLALLADIARRHPGHTIEIVSGYRHTGSPTSHHRKGGAIDLRVRGVSTIELRDYLWTHHSQVGVGWYRQQDFLHIDHRPGVPDIAWTQHRRDSSYQYHPSWAFRARRAAAMATRGAI
jgi:uncharacterized protein YcbK (DUF882 family)